jgi:RNA polymerase sigma-70 factor (ECF subfamily)
LAPSAFAVRDGRAGAHPVATTQVDRAASFTRLANDHLDTAYALAAVILGDPTEAQDATHDAIEKAWRAWPSLRSVDLFAPWFQRILVNCCRDRLRRRRRSTKRDAARRVELSEHEIGSHDADPSTRAAERDAIARVLDDLKADERIVIVLRFFLDLSVEEIANRLGVPLGTVKSRLHRGIGHLRAAYDAAERTSSEITR